MENNFLEGLNLEVLKYKLLGNSLGEYLFALVVFLVVITALKFFLSRPIFVVNSSTPQETQQSHIRTAELFEQSNPKELIKKYKIEGRIGMQLFVSEKEKERDE